MSKDDLFRNTLATNGLIRGYPPRSHKRKRRGLRFAFVILLLALASMVYFSSAASDKVMDQQLVDRADKAEEDAALLCLHMVEFINAGLVSMFANVPDVTPETLRLIEAYEGFCKEE